MPDPLTVTSIRGGVVEAVGAADRNTYLTSSGGTAVGGCFVDAVTPGSFLVNVAGATSIVCVGLAIHDQPAHSAIVTVAHHGIWYVTAVGAITAGQRLVCAANGKASAVTAVDATSLATLGTTATASRAIVAIAQEDIADTAQGRVKLLL